MASIFDVDENGQIVYEDNGNGADGSASPEVGLPNEGAADPEANIPENEVLESGTDNNQIIDEGINVPDEIQGTEIYPQEQENGETVYLGDSYNINLLSDEIQELLVNALAPASGTLSSSTIDYFDRIVSGLPSDYVYVAYRTDAQNNYNGVLYFSDNYDLEDNKVTFGEDTKEIRVIRSSYNGVNNVIQYYESEIDGASIAYDLNGDVLYYTNAEVGYPILGGIVKPMGYAPFVVCAVLVALWTVVIQILMKKSR